jgi:hypothetical protein
MAAQMRRKNVEPEMMWTSVIQKNEGQKKT